MAMSASFTMQVSAGGYVRSVAHELGELAGCGAHLATLRRTQAGRFTLAQAITLDELKRCARGDRSAPAASALTAAGDALGHG
jgi:tRNA U55 pseudouridine synthase TruB